MQSGYSEPLHGAAFKCAFIFALVFFLFVVLLPPQRVGDGSEYYGLFLAIHDGHRTFMTAPAWAAYNFLFTSSHIVGLVDPTSLKNTFPSLSQISGADFNHFWLYSALAAATSGWLTAFGLSVHECFLLLHALLLSVLVYVATKHFGKMGLLAVAIILVGSPIFWFIDKVHTEFFTFCCVSIGTLLFCRHRYFSAALWLALASTQNISIGATALFLLAVGAWNARHQNVSFRDAALAFIALILIAIHPIYYFFRVGVIDPQLLAGGAKIGANFRNMYIWFLDPDIGLIPNWPMSVAILAATAIALLVNQSKLPRITIAYVLVFITTNLYAQSSTTNLNSGATVDVARYATWYIGLFIPCLAFTLKLINHKCKLALKACAALLLLFFTFSSAAHFYPSKHETYLAPTVLSSWVQEQFPALYDPPAQIFADRNSGASTLPPSYAVVGPACKKVLVVWVKNSPVIPFAKNNCGLDLSKLPRRVLSPDWPANQLADAREQKYFLLTELERARATPTIVLNRLYEAGIGKPLVGAFLYKGWQQRETWGVWSSESHSELKAKVSACPANGLLVRLELIAFVNPKNPKVSLDISSQTSHLFTTTFETAGPVQASFNLPCSALNNGTLDLQFSYKGQTSPLQLGLSDDARVLAIGLRSLQLSSQSTETKVAGANRNPR